MVGQINNKIMTFSFQPVSAACGLTVGVKHVAGEPHLRRTERIIRGKTEDGWKHSTFKTCVLRTPETQREQRELLVMGSELHTTVGLVVVEEVLEIHEVVPHLWEQEYMTKLHMQCMLGFTFNHQSVHYRIQIRF